MEFNQSDREPSLAKGIGIGKVAREVGLGVGTVHRLKREIGGYAAI